VDSWKIDGHKGAVHAAGLGGTITGRGADLLVIDDYLKNREDAESEVIRNKTWHSLESDLLTRLAPTHAVVIVANRWHKDDIVGRIMDKNDPHHKNYDPDFPKFEIVTFPAEDPETGKFLFPERFSDEYYRGIRAFLGVYAWNAQGLQAPVPRKGALFNMNGVVVHDSIEDFPDIPYVRFWDLASTEKERLKDDPDATASALLGRVLLKGGGNALWIKDASEFYEEAPKRNRRIVATVEYDGPEVRVGIESVAGYKDAYTTLKNVLKGVRRVYKVTASKDKVVRATPLEAVFDACEVHILRAPGTNSSWPNVQRSLVETMTILWMRSLAPMEWYARAMRVDLTEEK